MSEEIPQWAQRRARDLIPVDMGLVVTAQDIADAFARYIAIVEQPPVDPALVWARDLIADAVGYGAGICVEPERKKPSDFRSGDCDDGDLIRRAVEGYRKHKEAGK